MVGEEFLFAACSLCHVFLQQLNVSAEKKRIGFVMGTSSDSCAMINGLDLEVAVTSFRACTAPRTLESPHLVVVGSSHSL